MRYISDIDLEKANKLFENVEKANYYAVSGDLWTTQYDYFETQVNARLDDDQVEFLDKLLTESEGCTIADLEEQIPFYDKLAPELYRGTFIPKTIDTVHPLHYYPFTCMTVDREKGTAQPQKVKICISDDDYIGLLAWRLGHLDDSLNNMAMFDPDLYARMMHMMALELCDPEYGITSRSPFVAFPDCLDEYIKAAND